MKMLQGSHGKGSVVPYHSVSGEIIPPPLCFRRGQAEHEIDALKFSLRTLNVSS